MEKLYKPFMMNNYRLIFTDVPSAEMIKYAANSMLATRISFMNDIANLCELVGADVNMVRKGIVQTAVSGVSSCIQAVAMVVLASRKTKGVDQDGGKEWLYDECLESGRGGE